MFQALGVLPFLSPGACPTASMVAWVGQQPFSYISVILLRRLACRGLLGSAPCVRELPLGLCLLFGRQCMTLLAFPYLRVGALLAWGVYGISCCEVCSLGCPSWFVLLFMSLFVLHLLLGWGGLVTGLWPRLQLLCVGLF